MAAIDKLDAIIGRTGEGEMNDERERRIAVRDAEQHAVEESYFGARHHSIDTRDRRSVFGAAFRMAWETVESLQSQLAAANNALFQAQEAAKHQGERADGLQRVVEAARGQVPVGVITSKQRQDSFPVWITGIELNHSVPTGTKLYAAPVPAQPAVVPEGPDRSSD